MRCTTIWWNIVQRTWCLYGVSTVRLWQAKVWLQGFMQCSSLTSLVYTLVIQLLWDVTWYLSSRYIFGWNLAVAHNCSKSQPNMPPGKKTVILLQIHSVVVWTHYGHPVCVTDSLWYQRVSKIILYHWDLATICNPGDTLMSSLK